MKNRPFVIALTLVFVALFTWSLVTTIGASVKGGHEPFVEWRSENVALFYGIWLATVIVAGVPALYFVGRELNRFAERQDETALAAKGVGRFAAAALRGDKNAIAKLLSLLDDPTPVVRYQSARALALLDDPATNKELFRKVRYWDVDLKLGLVDALKRTSDMRAGKLMRVLAKDRNPMVARRASTAIQFVGGKGTNMDWLVEQRKQEAQKRTKKKAAAAPADEASADETPADEAAADEASDQAPADEAPEDEAPNEAPPTQSPKSADASDDELPREEQAGPAG